MAELTRKGIVEAAIAIADEHGLDAVTFRSVADRLGAHFTSLRHYYATKNDLLDAMADTLLAEAGPPPGPASDWRRALRTLARGLEGVASAHPRAVTVLVQRAAAGPSAVDMVEGCLASLERGGFTPRRANDAFAAFNALVLGLTLQADPRADAQPEPTIDSATHPRVARLSAMGRGGWSTAVDALIAGLDAQLGAKRRQMSKGDEVYRKQRHSST